MNISEKSLKILSRLNSAGYQAYLVGGCVRDMLMENAAHDIDITTDAMPSQVIEVFNEYDVISTGIKHGTVTVIFEKTPFEITTYRVDGCYSDSRRPDNVKFTSSLIEDLSRRDFTINSIAMDKSGIIIDPFNGVSDINKKIIRCVGSPRIRFREDALRIMRAVRFSAQLGFQIDSETSTGVHEMREYLKHISAERIRDELDKIICGKNCVDVLLQYSDIITQIIPEFSPCIGFIQHSPYHRYDVWEHTVRAIDSAPKNNIKLRRVMLFHDIGKPECFRLDENGRGHFDGHGIISAEKAHTIMRYLRYDNKSISDIITLIQHHSDKIHSKIQLKKIISEIGAELTFDLLEIKKADNSAKQSFVLKEVEEINKLEAMMHEMIRSNECCTLSQLAVNGDDLLCIGICGRSVGEILSELLEIVIEDELPNDKDVLLKYVRRRYL